MSKTINDCIIRHISIESEDDLTEYDAGGYYLDVDIGDKVILCEDAAVYMVEDDKAWKIYYKADFLDEIYKTDSYFGNPLSEEDLQKKSREAHEKFEMYCNASLKGQLDKVENKPYEPSFDYSNPSEVFKQFGENTKMDKEQLFESLLNETQIEVFPQNGKLQARGIGDKVVSSKTHNKMSGLDTQATTLPLGRNQLAGTKAVIAYLKSKNKLNDIANEFDTDPRPDITFNPTGDAIITPDGGNGRPYTIPAAEIEPFYEGVFSPKPWSAKGIEKAKAKKEKQVPHKYSVHISDIDVKQLFGLMAMQNTKKDVDLFGFGIAKVAGKFYLYLWHPTEVNWRHPKMGLNELTGWSAEITLSRLSIDFTDEMADDLCHWIKDKEFMGVSSGRVWPIYASPVGSNGLAKYEGIMVFGDDASSVHKYIKLYDKLTNGKNALPIDEGSAFGGDISDIPNKFQMGSYLSVDLDPEEIMSLGIGQRDIRDETTGKPYGEVSLDESKAALFDKLLEE